MSVFESLHQVPFVGGLGFDQVRECCEAWESLLLSGTATDIQAYNIAEAARAIEKMFHSPVQALGRCGLGDPRRTDYLKQLSGAGPVELEASAVLAVMTGDRLLGAALLRVADQNRANKNRDVFSVKELAQRLVGEETEEIRMRLNRVLRLCDQIRKES